MGSEKLLASPNVREARLYKRAGGDALQCGVCERRCIIPPGQVGFCKTRMNIEGRLYTLVYGDVSSMSANPIEKKPFFQFWPGSYALTIGTWSCNFTCPWCVHPEMNVLIENECSMKIKNLENGWKDNKVLSFDEKTRTIQPSKIEAYIKIDPGIYGLNTFKITTKETGRELIASEDHPIYTERGLVLLREVKAKEKVVVYPAIPIERKKIENDFIIIDKKNILTIINNLVPRSDEDLIIKSLKEKKMLPLRISNKKLPVLTRILGFLFGDGTLPLSRTKTRDRLYMAFTGKDEDLREIKEDLESLGFHASRIITREKVSRMFRYGKAHTIRGRETHFTCNSKALSILMIALGAPVGDKAKNLFHVPTWLLNSPLFIKREFLAAYFGSELTKPRIDLSGKNFLQPRFSINKREGLIDNAIEFVKDLQELLSEFNVKISSYNYHKGSVRKDGTKTLTLYVLFANNLGNLINLFGKIGYRYCEERETLARYALEYLLMKRKTKEGRKNAYLRALDLKKAGTKISEIHKEVKDYVTLYDLGMWIRKRINPENIKFPKDFPKFKEWIAEHTRKLKDGLVWETIEEIEKVVNDDVRDLTVNRFHNFFANGFLVSNCQNYDISKVSPQPLKANYVSPERFVRMVNYERCQGTSISFNEPTTLFEYSLDVFPLAHGKGLYNTFVSNGYMTLEALHMLKDAGMDAIKIDVKGDEAAVQKYCGADVNVVWRNVGEAKRLGMHVEVVMLVIPGVNDDEDCLREIARRHLKEAGPESPLHFTQFYPAYRMKDRSRTPVETLEKAHSIAIEEGVQYVYAGNVPGHRLENTYCPDCGELLIGRLGFAVTEYRITPDKRCPRCGLEIPITGEYVKSAPLRWLF